MRHAAGSGGLGAISGGLARKFVAGRSASTPIHHPVGRIETVPIVGRNARAPAPHVLRVGCVVIRALGSSSTGRAVRGTQRSRPEETPPNNALQRTRRQSLRSFLLAAELDIVRRGTKSWTWFSRLPTNGRFESQRHCAALIPSSRRVCPPSRWLTPGSLGTPRTRSLRRVRVRQHCIFRCRSTHAASLFATRSRVVLLTTQLGRYWKHAHLAQACPGAGTRRTAAWAPGIRHIAGRRSLVRGVASSPA